MISYVERVNYSIFLILESSKIKYFFEKKVRIRIGNDRNKYRINGKSWWNLNKDSVGANVSLYKQD